jgi:hypothetical protein
MTKRGRKSGASLAIRPVTPIETTQRPVPPDELSDEGAAEWREIVDRLPADWFTRETQALLVQYCRHVVAARHVSQLIAAIQEVEKFDFKAYHDALKMQQRESGILASLATKMRISQQSTYDKSRKKARAGKLSRGPSKLDGPEFERLVSSIKPVVEDFRSGVSLSDAGKCNDRKTPAQESTIIRATFPQVVLGLSSDSHMGL